MNARLERRLAVANWIGFCGSGGNFFRVVFTGKATEATTATARTSHLSNTSQKLYDALTHAHQRHVRPPVRLVLESPALLPQSPLKLRCSLCSFIACYYLDGG